MVIDAGRGVQVIAGYGVELYVVYILSDGCGRGAEGPEACGVRGGGCEVALVGYCICDDRLRRSQSDVSGLRELGKRGRTHVISVNAGDSDEYSSEC